MVEAVVYLSKKIVYIVNAFLSKTSYLNSREHGNNYPENNVGDFSVVVQGIPFSFVTSS
jgi:hypothetical protein